MAIYMMTNIYSHTISLSQAFPRYIDPTIGMVTHPMTQIFWNFVSPKQNVRPDSFLECFFQIIPDIKQNLTLQACKIYSLCKGLIQSDADIVPKVIIDALNILKRIDDSPIENKSKESLDPKEKQSLSIFLTLAFAKPSFLNDSNMLLITSQSPPLTQTYKALKDIVKACPVETVELLQAKIKMIGIFLDSTSKEEFNPCFKLTAFDARLLFVAKRRKHLLERLNESEIQILGARELLDRWTIIAELNESDTMKKIRQLCQNEILPGRLLLGNRFHIRQLRDETFNFVACLKHIIFGKLNHIMIAVNKHGKAISHCNSTDNKHSIKPIGDPLFFGFTYRFNRMFIIG